jgi:arylsulfatase A-like enzyme
LPGGLTGAALFAAHQCLAAAVALALAELAFRGREPWRRGLAALAAFPLVACGALLLANHALGLRRDAVTALLAAMGVPGLLFLSFRWRRRPLAGGAGAPAAGPPAREAGDPLELACLGLAGGLLAAFAFKTALLGTSFIWDDLSYHAVLPARWLADGAISVPPFTFQAYFPFNAELLSLWFSLPFGRDAWASLGAATWGSLAAVSLALLAREIGGRGLAVVATLALFFASYVVWFPVRSYSATDLAAAAACLAALAFQIPGPGPRGPTLADAAASGLLAGFAVGCKVSLLPAALAIGAGAALGPAAREALARARWGRAAAFAACLLATGSYWYLRNALLTGNPLFPAEVGPFEGPFDAGAQARTRLASRLAAAPLDLSLWRRAVVGRLNWPPGLALLAALGYASALGSLSGARTSAAGRRLRLLLALCGASLLLVYPFLPFSGTGNRPDAELHSGYLRFLILPFGIGLVLFSEQLREGARGRALCAAAAIVAVASSWRLEALLSLAAFLGGLGVLLLHRRLRAFAAALAASPARLVAALALAFSLLALWTPVKQRLTDENLFAFRSPRGPVGEAWRALESLPAGSRVAFFMSEPYEYTHFYPIFGRAGQLAPVLVDADGSPHAPLHESWRSARARGASWWSDWEARGEALDPERLRLNLAVAGADYALVTRWSLGEWPPQYEALARSGSLERLYDDGFSVLFRLAPRPAEPGAAARLPDATSVVLVTIDTLRADHLSRNGHARATTPALDRLAREGVYFPRCYAQSSWTLPSMLSLFSSLSPAVFGVREGVTPVARPGQRAPEPRSARPVRLEVFSEHYLTLPEVLRERGFATVGFSTNGHLRIEQGFAQGFEHFDQRTCMWADASCALGAALRWVDAHLAAPRVRPFFLWVHLFDPHFDEQRDARPVYRPPPGYGALFGSEEPGSLEERTRRDYDRKVRFADDRLGEFAEGLRARGLLDRSVLAVAADHGEEFNEHGLWGHSKSLRNTLVHVPLLLRFPGGEPRGEFGGVVSNLDLAPTLLDFLGVPVPASMGGRSLLPGIRGEPAAPRPVYGETRRLQLDLRFWADPASDRKLVLDLARGSRQLFRLSGDADEREDLAAREPERADALERALRASIAEQEALRVPTEREGTLGPEELEHLRDLGYLE